MNQLLLGHCAEEMLTQADIACCPVLGILDFSPISGKVLVLKIQQDNSSMPSSPAPRPLFDLFEGHVPSLLFGHLHQHLLLAGCWEKRARWAEDLLELMLRSHVAAAGCPT